MYRSRERRAARRNAYRVVTETGTEYVRFASSAEEVTESVERTTGERVTSVRQVHVTDVLR